MEKQNKLILAFPRSGTKLLANIYKKQGYHNFGEFFNTYSTVIIDASPPYASRMPIDHQRKIINAKSKRGKQLDHWSHMLDANHRLAKFNKFKDIGPNILTTFIWSFTQLPETFELLNDREVLCLRRANIFDQILSRIITKKYLNHDGEHKSKPIKVDLEFLEYTFYNLLKLERLQDYCVSTGRGRYIDFDKLVAGKEDLGFPYIVDTTDQHANLEELVLNLTEVKEKFQELQVTYNVS